MFSSSSPTHTCATSKKKTHTNTTTARGLENLGPSLLIVTPFGPQNRVDVKIRPTAGVTQREPISLYHFNFFSVIDEKSFVLSGGRSSQPNHLACHPHTHTPLSHSVAFFFFFFFERKRSVCVLAYGYTTCWVERDIPKKKKTKARWGGGEVGKQGRNG